MSAPLYLGSRSVVTLKAHVQGRRRCVWSALLQQAETA
jgi:hypothetical protein